LGSAVIIFLIAGGLLFITVVLKQDDTPITIARSAMTLNPTIQANVTNIPLATALSAEDANEFLRLQARIEVCNDYSPERLSQMHQHIDWLIDPSTIPADIITAFGTNVPGSLVFGMASYTSIQWRLLDRPPDSCLVEIGRDLNILLEAFGQPRLDIYDDLP